MILATMISCGEGNSNSSSSKVSTTSNILVDGDLLTKYAQKSIIECSLRDIENNPLDYSVRESGYGQRFDIQVSSVLSRKITDNLQKRGLIEKITPSTFWKVLDSNLKKELNEVLVESDIKRSYEDFLRLQQEVAFAYTVYVENPTYNDGYRIEMSDGRKTLMAFTEYTKAVRSISPCENFEMNSVEVDTNLLKPADITARVSCQNKDGERLLIDEYKNKDIFLSVNANEIIENFMFRTKQLQIYKDSRNSRELIYAGDFNYDYLFFDIDKVHSSKPNSIERIDLQIYPTGSEAVEVNKLDCITIKELTL